MNACKNLSSKEIENLGSTARDFFHFVQNFDNFLKIKDSLNIWMVENPIEMTKTVTCGIFLLYFYENLFDPPTNSKIQNQKKMTEKNNRDFTKRIVFVKQSQQK